MVVGPRSSTPDCACCEQPTDVLGNTAGIRLLYHDRRHTDKCRPVREEECGGGIRGIKLVQDDGVTPEELSLLVLGPSERC